MVVVSLTIPQKRKRDPDVKTTKPHIERILRLQTYKVNLSCGHSFECSVEEMHRANLFIGKSVQCLVLLCYKMLIDIGMYHERYREVGMSVVKAKIQTVEDMYRLIWTAIANK
jgi:hypothetical protein